MSSPNVILMSLQQILVVWIRESLTLSRQLDVIHVEEVTNSCFISQSVGLCRTAVATEHLLGIHITLDGDLGNGLTLTHGVLDDPVDVVEFQAF